MIANVMEYFTFVVIPCDPGKPMEEVRHPCNTLLENDNLRDAIKLRFASSGLSAEETAAYVDGLRQQIEEREAKNGTAPGPSGMTDDVLRRLAGAVNVDTYALTVPTKTVPLAVSLYCDEKGTIKNLPINHRAIGLASGCGSADQQFRGDCFVSRYFDDDEAWLRRDFTLADCSSDAAWVVEAARGAAQRKSPAGMASLSSMYEQLGAGGSARAPPVQVDARAAETAAMEATHTCATFSWTQNAGELEVRVPVPAATRAKDVKVDVKRHSVMVQCAGQTEPPLHVAALFAPLDVAATVWTLDGAGADRCIVLSLEKATSGSAWPQLGAE